MRDETEVAERVPPFLIEGARSNRSRCKICRRTINKGALRLGVLIEGPYGTGYLWHHLNCAARRRFDDVQSAYEAEAWKEAKEPPRRVPTLDKLRGLREQAEHKRATRKSIPYAELDPSGRAKCKQCGGSSICVHGRIRYYCRECGGKGICNRMDNGAFRHVQAYFFHGRPEFLSSLGLADNGNVGSQQFHPVFFQHPHFRHPAAQLPQSAGPVSNRHWE